MNACTYCARPMSRERAELRPYCLANECVRRGMTDAPFTAAYVGWWNEQLDLAEWRARRDAPLPCGTRKPADGTTVRRAPVRVAWNGRSDGPTRATGSTGSESPVRALVIRSEWLTRDAADIRARLLSRAGHALWTYYCAVGDSRAHSATGVARVTRDDIAHAAYLHLAAMVDDTHACAYDITTRTPSAWWHADTESTRTRGYMLTRAISRGMATCRMRADIKAREQLAIDGQRTMGGDAAPQHADRIASARIIARESDVSDAIARMIRATATRDALNGSREGMAIARALGMLTDGADLEVAADRARALAAGEYRSQWTTARGRLSRYASRVLSDAQGTYEDLTALA